MKKTDNDRCIRRYQKKDGTTVFHAEVRRKHATPIRGSFRTLTEAKNWVRKTESTILDGQHVPDNKARKHTLADLIDRYMSIHLSKFPRRLKDQATHLHWWKEIYGAKLLIEVTSALLVEAREKLLNGITSRNTPRTGSTVNRYFSSLSKAFSLAFQEWQWINENPFRRLSKLKENAGRTRFLTKEELNRLLECCKISKNPHLHGIVLIAASMGLRFGEIVALKWQHIDFEHGFIALERTKNGDERFVPMPDQVAICLKALPRLKLQDEYLFPSRNPDKRHPYSLIRKAFYKALLESNIQEFTFHCLRHTAASHLAMNGASQNELMEILGHRSPMMSKRYAHFSKEHIARILQKTSNHLLTTQGDPP